MGRNIFGPSSTIVVSRLPTRILSAGEVKAFLRLSNIQWLQRRERGSRASFSAEVHLRRLEGGVGRYSYLMSTVDTSPNISQIYLSRCLDRFTGLPTPPRLPLFPMQDVSSNKSEQCVAMKQPAPQEVCHFGRHICTAHKPLRREVFHLRHAAEGAKSKELILLVLCSPSPSFNFRTWGSFHV